MPGWPADSLAHPFGAQRSLPTPLAAAADNANKQSKGIRREDEPEEYWSSKGEREGKNPLSDPLAQVGGEPSGGGEVGGAQLNCASHAHLVVLPPVCVHTFHPPLPCAPDWHPGHPVPLHLPGHR